MEQAIQQAGLRTDQMSWESLIQIKFRHEKTPGMHRSGHLVSHITQCKVVEDFTNPHNHTVTTMGWAYCSISDQFSRFEGRRLSFKRAISAYPRSLRKQLWAEYWKQFPGRD